MADNRELDMDDLQAEEWDCRNCELAALRQEEEESSEDELSPRIQVATQGHIGGTQLNKEEDKESTEDELPPCVQAATQGHVGGTELDEEDYDDMYASD